MGSSALRLLPRVYLMLHSAPKSDTDVNLGHKGIWISVQDEREWRERYKHFWR